MDINEWMPSSETFTWGDFDKLDEWVKAIKAKLLDAEDRFNRSQLSYRMSEQQMTEVVEKLNNHHCQHGTTCVPGYDT